MESRAASLLLALVREGPAPRIPLGAAERDALLALAARTEVLGLVTRRLPAADPELSRERRHELERWRRDQARHHGYFFSEAQRLSAALARAGIRCVVLKGVSLAGSLYDAPSERSFRDLDLLVAEDEVERASESLEAAGYAVSGPPELRRHYRRGHFHLIFSGSAGVKVELHWGLSRPDEICRPRADWLLEGADDDGSGFLVPRPEAQALHCTLNLLRCGFTELKRLVDLDRLLRRHPRIDHELVASWCRESGLLGAWSLALRLAREMLGTPIVAEPPALPPRTLSALHRVGIEHFPLRSGPARRPLAPHYIRWLLVEQRGRLAAQLLARPAFERRRQRLLGVPAWRRQAATAKRAARCVQLALWVASLRLRLRHVPRLPLTTSSPTSS